MSSLAQRGIAPGRFAYASASRRAMPRPRYTPSLEPRLGLKAWTSFTIWTAFVVRGPLRPSRFAPLLPRRFTGHSP